VFLDESDLRERGEDLNDSVPSNVPRSDRSR
jgi:hypothetical protein